MKYWHLFLTNDRPKVRRLKCQHLFTPICVSSNKSTMIYQKRWHQLDDVIWTQVKTKKCIKTNYEESIKNSTIFLSNLFVNLLSYLHSSLCIVKVYKQIDLVISRLHCMSKISNMLYCNNSCIKHLSKLKYLCINNLCHRKNALEQHNDVILFS